MTPHKVSLNSSKPTETENPKSTTKGFILKDSHSITMKPSRHPSSYSFSSSDTSSSDDEESTFSETASDHKLRKGRRKNGFFTKPQGNVAEEPTTDRQNVLYKVLNRERYGFFSRNATGRVHQKPFDVVPSQMSFCLKDIVPICYLSGHIFMGLTVCGQFLLSYKVVVSEEPETDFNQFSAGSYKYELFFWIYRPHQLLRKYYSICLFDDHGVDNVKTVTMCQWFSSARTLIVHGANEFETEHSFVSIVAVPRLGCLDCRQLRDEHFFANQEDAYSRSAALCITCNLTIHTKYTRSESDPRFDPRVNLNCPQRLILFTNGLIHMLNVDLQTNKPPKSFCTSLDVRYVQRESIQPTDTPVVNPEMSVATSHTTAPQPPHPKDTVKPDTPPEPQTRENIIARIIADFDECESSSNELLPTKSAATKYFEELVINTNSTVPISARTSTTQPDTQRGRFLTYRRTTNSPHLPTTSNPQTLPKHDVAAASRAYEFSEETEKYEKISSFRKRRLADKKYEFSEDNSENIIPFAKLRMRRQNGPLASRLISSPTRSVDSSLLHQPQPAQQQHTHRASPSHGFRSPCGSPVGNRYIIMSPPSGVRGGSTTQLYGRSPTYKPFSSSPRHQIVHTKRSTGHYFDGSEFSNSGAIYSPLLLSPRSDADFELFRHGSASATPFIQPLTEVKPSNISADPISLVNTASALDKNTEPKPVCAKKLIRHYVEEDDTTSVITSEEDDCISPGYHTSLPVEVHGACYSGMQLVSAASYQQRLLRTGTASNITTPSMNAAVLVTQHTFDLETLTYHIANRLCVMHNKQYGFFYDWACEPVHICPHSAILTSLLIVNFTARDTPSAGSAPCLNCSNREQLDCAFHRRHFECRSMFTWNVGSGDWTILDYGEMTELPPSVLRKRNATGSGVGGGANADGGGSGAPSELTRIVRKMARDLSQSMRDDEPANWSGLYTLDSSVERSKEVLRDQHNSIEFYRGVTGSARAGLRGVDDDDDDDNHVGHSFMDSSDSSDFE